MSLADRLQGLNPDILTEGLQAAVNLDEAVPPLFRGLRYLPDAIGGRFQGRIPIYNVNYLVNGAEFAGSALVQCIDLLGLQGSLSEAYELKDGLQKLDYAMALGSLEVVMSMKMFNATGLPKMMSRFEAIRDTGRVLGPLVLNKFHRDYERPETIIDLNSAVYWSGVGADTVMETVAFASPVL